MLLLIDNYDSFTYNLVHYLGELGVDVVVKRNDELTIKDALKMEPTNIMLSPGPCDPEQAGICLELTKAAAVAKIPLIGVCLGHQTIGQAFGGKIIHAKTIMHGKTSLIEHNNQGVFNGLKNPFVATRYHSLVVEKVSCPDCFDITAWTDDEEIMGIKHKTLPIEGVQFHPESILSEHGHDLLRNFIQNND